MQIRLVRTEVPVESTWDLSELFADDAAWEAEYRAVDEARAPLGVFEGQLGAGADQLLACLNALESLQTRVMRVASFAHLRNAQDGTHPPHQAALARVAARRARVGAGTAFVDAEILAFPEGLLEQFMASEPGLAPFKRMLTDLLELRPHRLGADADARGDHVVPAFSDALDDRVRIGDDLLRLVFTACHPVRSREAQVALHLRLLGGLTTTEIARAFLVPEPTIAQCIGRAQRR